MIFIDDSLKSVKKAKSDHFNTIATYLKSRHPRGSLITNFIHSNLTDLIKGSPSKLLELNQQFYNNYPGHSHAGFQRYIILKTEKPNRHHRNPTEEILFNKYESLNEIISRIINYGGWFIKSSKMYDYELTMNLNFNTCVYCNRSYTHTLTDRNTRLVRPQLDHWFPKAFYPLLALSFYNLIPSCSNCNTSVKHDTNLNLDDHIHPYLNNIIDEFEFDYKYDRSLKKHRIKIKTSNVKVKETLKIFYIKEIYYAHQEELIDLFKIKSAYSKKYLETLMSSFPNANLSENEIYRLAFGTEIEKGNFHKRPLSKFKYDILKKLEIINDK